MTETDNHTFQKSCPKKAPHFDASEADLPGELDNPTFRAAWSRWVERRKEMKKPLTFMVAYAQLKKMAEMGNDQAIEAIEHTIAMGWQGLRRPEKTETPRQKLPCDEDLANWKP